MMTKRRSNLIAVAKNMPKLHHSVNGEEFNIQHSEVIKWILQHDEAWEYIWNNIKGSGAIKYDPVSKTWRGINNAN